jgi:hypothetical protein
MNIQLISNKPIVFRVKNKEYEYVKPYYLITGLNMIKAVVKGSTMCWNIEGDTISYNQIRSATKK